MVTAVHLWVWVIESGLLGICLSGTRVRDKQVVGTKMDGKHKIESF